MIPKKLKFDGDRQELIQPVLPGVPLSFFISRFSPDTYDFVNWHWHNAFQYSLVTEGSVEFFLSGQKHIIEAGNGIFINYRQMHYMRGHDKDSTSEYISVDIPPSLISSDERGPVFTKYMKPVLDNPLPPVLLLKSCENSNRKILDAIASMRDILTQGNDMPELAVSIKALELWVLTWPKICGKLSAEHSCTAGGADRLRSIFLYMEEHYGEKILLEDIASLVSLSREECSRFFRKQTGQSLFEYLTAYRLNRSIELLRDTSMSIADVAAAAGFGSQSYYTSCFRKSRRITPGQFRELSLRNSDELKIR